MLRINDTHKHQRFSLSFQREAQSVHVHVSCLVRFAPTMFYIFQYSELFCMLHVAFLAKSQTNLDKVFSNKDNRNCCFVSEYGNLIPYTCCWKNWRSLNLAVRSQTKCKKINQAVAAHSILCHHKHSACVYQGVLPSFRLRYMNKAMSLQIYKKYNWQQASAKLVICTAHIEGHRAGPRALLHALHHYALRAKIKLADFNLAILRPDRQITKFNFPSNFLAIQ